MEAFVGTLGSDSRLALHPCYQGYFTCFNAGDYYEAHDVLEHLWLQRRDENYAFFKGLIQVAGAFVHLKKQYHHPSHPTHGRRLHPAVRLFRLAAQNLAPFAPRHLHLDVAALCEMCAARADEIADSGFTRNPWHPADAPRLVLEVEG